MLKSVSLMPFPLSMNLIYCSSLDENVSIVSFRPFHGVYRVADDINKYLLYLRRRDEDFFKRLIESQGQLYVLFG